ncbi:MAG TPA: hypothetical protein VK817_09700 [Trebonia sp.]|jgi:hypothetical protein|nr:hypothetical protein [Trebonia sp.]
MTDPAQRAWRRVRDGDDPRQALAEVLSPGELQSLLMDVSQRRAAGVTPGRLAERWAADRFVRAAGCDPRRVSRIEARLWELLPDEFDGIDLSPVAPLGTSSALGPVSQHKVISTTRGTEVVSDPTNVLALEAARRRRTSGAEAVHLAACHRVLRGQPFGEGMFQHFRLFAVVSSAPDRGSGSTEAGLLTAHLRFWTRALSDLLPAARTTVSYTVFGFPPLAERIRDTVLPALKPLPGNVTVAEDPDRERARGYYERGALRIDTGPAANTSLPANPGLAGEIGDGGFTGWTARLLNNAKERCLISCVATERLAAVAAAVSR